MLRGPWRWHKLGWGILLSLGIADLFAMLPETLGLAKGEITHEKLVVFYEASLSAIPVGLIEIALFYVQTRKRKRMRSCLTD